MRTTKRVLSIVLAVIMAMPAIIAAPFGAEAADVSASDYWQIMASTDFTTAEFTGSGTEWSTSYSPTTSKGGNQMGWGVHYRSDETFVNNVDGKGVRFITSDQGLIYLSSYNGQTANNIFNGVDSFKIDVAFELFDETYVHNGIKFNRREGQQALFKLSTGDANKYKFSSKYNTETVYFAQEAWGRRFINGTGDIYAVSGTQDGGNYAITTAANDSGVQINPNIHAGTVYHYVMYVANGFLGCYLADNAGNTVINYDPIELPANYQSPSAITNILLNASEFNFWAYRGLENIYYRSVEVYKGVDTSTNDTSKSKYLFTYFTGNSANGESLHYALSDDGINFKPVNDGMPVWDSSASYSISSYPAGGASGVATSKHVRDPYILQKRNTSTGALTSGYYILATDLNTQNGSNWGNNSKLLVYDVANLQNISSVTPWVIDTEAWASAVGAGSISRAWAPQAIWDPVAGKYMLYWSIGYVGGLTKVYYIYTSDFKTFDGTPKQLVAPHFCNNFIDADITFCGGLYYMFLKDEDAKKIYRLVAPSANGPYSGSTKFSDTGMEGPQVYQLTNGNYVLMTDAYGEGNFYMYNAVSPAKFSSASPISTNINYLSPRHGSVIRITPEEYNAIATQFGTLTPNTVEYLFANDASWGADNPGFGVKDTGGHDFSVGWYYGGISVGSNKINITSGGIYMEDATVNQYLTSSAYTVDFTYKSTNASQRTDDHSIVSISKADAQENYVRVSASGKIFVNGTEVAYLNQSKLTSAIADSNAHNYKLTFNGTATALLVDDVYVGGAINTTVMQNNLWLTFAWSRGTMEDTRSSGEFGKITISPVGTEIGDAAEEALVSTVSPDRSALTSAPTFNEAAYHRGDGNYNAVGSDYYSNLVYITPYYHNQNDFGGAFAFTDELIDDHLRFKFATPSAAVGIYDGVTNPSMPVVFETYWNNRSNSEILHYVQPYANSQASWDARKVEFRYLWYGYGTDWNSWPTSSSQSFASEAAKQKSHSNYNNSNPSSDDKGKDGKESSNQNNNEHRFWRNSLQYVGNGDTNNYYELLNTNMEVCHSAKGLVGNRYMYYKQQTMNTNFYVINYRPVYDIIKTGTTATKSTNQGNKTALQLYDYLMDEDGEAQWMYTAASRINALTALKKIADCNPNNFNYASDVSGQVDLCGKAIKAAKEAWDGINLVKNTFTITYNRADGNQSETVTAGNNIANISSNSVGVHFEGSENHFAYNWVRSSGVWNNDQTPSTSHVPHSNETYYEEKDSNPTACSIGADKTQWPHVNANGDNNGYRHDTCSVCSHHYVIYDDRSEDWGNYATAASQIESNYNSSAYTTVSRQAYKTNCEAAIADIALRDETKSQAYIQRYIDALEDEKDTLDKLADFSYFETTYDKANTFLMSQVGKVPEYEATSMQELIDAVDDEDVAAYIATDDDDRAEYGQAVQTEINALADTINNKMDGLKTMVDVGGTGGTTDYSVYEEAVNILNNFDPDAYDETESIISARSTINTVMDETSNATTVTYASVEGDKEIPVLNSTLKNQEDIDALIDTTVSALTISIKKYDISTEGETGDISFRNGSLDDNNKAPYGTSIRCTAADEETAWYIEITTSSMHKKEAYAGYGKYFSTKVLGATNIKAVRRGSGESKVRIVRKYDNAEVNDRSPLQVVDFVETNTSYELPTAPAIAYYEFDGYYSDGSKIDSATVDITEDTDIIARYVFRGASCSINSTDISGAQTNTSVSYNDKVELEGGEGTYAWLEATDSTGARFRPFFIGENVSFFASESVDLKAVDETEFNSYNFSLPTINMRKEGVITQTIEDNKVKTIFNAQLVPGNANIQEYGILVAAPSSKNGAPITPTDSQVIIENSGQQVGYAVYRAKSTKLVGANQFTIAMNNLPDDYIYRGYIIYKDSNGKLKNVYSQAMR